MRITVILSFLAVMDAVTALTAASSDAWRASMASRDSDESVASSATGAGGGRPGGRDDPPPPDFFFPIAQSQTPRGDALAQCAPARHAVGFYPTDEDDEDFARARVGLLGVARS